MKSARKKRKVDKSKGAIPLVLTNGDINKIGDKFHKVKIETWDKIDNLYRALLVDVQQGILELKALP